LGPLLVSVAVYVALVPAVTEAGPLAVTAMSAAGNGFVIVRFRGPCPRRRRWRTRWPTRTSSSRRRRC
jgi:hypothetical protein